MNQDKLLVAIPTYNERDNINPLYQKIKNLELKLDILFVDDNSPDGTGQVIDQLISQDKQVHVLHRPGKLGLGTAQRACYEFAREKKYGYLITMDADFTHDPTYIPQMFAKRDSADIIIGSRYADGGTMHGWASYRLPFTYFWRFLIKTFLGMPYDCTGAFRFYHCAVLEPGIYKNVQATGFAFGMEFLYRLIEHGARVNEIPIQAHSRIHGESKLSNSIMKEAASTFLRLSKDNLSKKFRRR